MHMYRSSYVDRFVFARKVRVQGKRLRRHGQILYLAKFEFRKEVTALRAKARYTARGKILTRNALKVITIQIDQVTELLPKHPCFSTEQYTSTDSSDRLDCRFIQDSLENCDELSRVGA